MTKAKSLAILFAGLAGATLATTNGIAMAGTAAEDAATLIAGKPLKGKSELTPPEGAALPDATGTVKVMAKSHAKHGDRFTFQVGVEGLAADTTYSLLAADAAAGGALTEFGTLTTDAEGSGGFKADTKKGDTLPFGATLADLAGGALEVRDAAGATVLAGTIPAAE